jgi:hypothetical protein
MSRVEDLLKAIESHEFAAVLNLASDLRTFLRILGSEKAVQDLAAAMGKGEVRGAVAERILTLLKRPGDEGNEHPRDSALAAYLSLLSSTDTRLAKQVAEQIAAVPRCWWARKIAEGLLAGENEGGPGQAVRPPPSPALEASRIETSSR